VTLATESKACVKRTLSHNSLVLLWLTAGILLVGTLSLPSVDRSQEARVLETAREMMDAPLHGWMIPTLNEQVRLHKPPLAYWLAAGSFKLFGVHPWAGRLPFAIAGWLALGLTYAYSARFFGQSAAVLAAGALLGSMMFSHHARLAETDILVLLSITAAVYSFTRAFDPAEESQRTITRWIYAGSLAVGLVILSKGLPALFAIIFLIALTWKTRRWDRLWLWIKSGAPLLILLIGTPWFIYVIHVVGAGRFAEEARIVAVGEEHRGSFINYLPDILLAIAPWTALTVAAIALSITRWRRDLRLATLLLWLSAIVLPLCLAGQKQKHYLMPALPTLAILSGWFLDRSLRAARGTRLANLGKFLLIATAAVSIVAGLGVPIAGWLVRGQILPIDWAFMLVVLLIGAAFFNHIARRRLGSAVVILLIASAIFTTLIDGVWIQTFKRRTPERVAAAIREFGADRPIRFYGTPSLPLIFALRTVVPTLSTPDQLIETSKLEPRAIVLISQDTKKPAPLPDILVERQSFANADKTIRICEFAPPVPH
jgi:4-amino-4-deoxy-L-arabinose transferase-like glycosyltransferase